MKINTKRYGIVHYIAECQECKWSAAITTKKTFSTQDVRNAIRRHIKNTGHSVHLESGSHTRYSIK